MANNADLRVRISADLSDIKQGLGLLRGELARVKSAAAQSTPSTAGWKTALTSIRAQLAGIVSLYAAMRSVRAYAELSDQSAKLEGRLKLATQGQAAFNKAYESTYKLAQDSQADWGSIVGLFSQLTQTTGQSQERILNLTKVISQAFRVSGASTEDTANGLRQLQQAMAGGVLRAEEFNTIVETSPRIVQALADHFGISFGQVRKYVNEGKVTTQQFMLALEESSASIQSDFDKLPKTVGGAVQQVRNALVKMVGDTNTATGASGDLATAVSSLARTLESPGVKSGFTAFIALLANGTEEVVKLIAKIGELGSAAAEYLASNEKKSTVSLQNRRTELESKLFAAERRSGQGLGDANDPLAKLLGLPSGKDSQVADLKREIAEIDALLEARSKLVKKADEAAASPPTTPPTETPAGKAIAASNALQRDAVTRAIAEVERLYKASEIGTRDYFATLTGLQQQAIDLQIQQARNELAVTKDKGQRLKLEEEIAILQRDRAEVSQRNARDEQQAQDAMIDKLGDVKAQLADLDGDAGKAARIRIEAQFAELFKQLERDSDATGKALVRNLADRLIAKAQAEAIAGRVSSVTGGLSAQEQSISAQMDAGALGQGEGERRLQEIRQKSLEQLRQLREEQRLYLAGLSAGTPEYVQALEGLANIDTNIANVTASMQKFRMSVQDQATSSLSGFFDDLIDGAKSFKDAFADLVRSFLAGIAKMIAQELALRAVRGIFSAIGGGVTASAKGNVFDGGGLRAFARGAVFPTIAAFAAGGAFTNQVVASPTLFAFGKGGQLGVMGEDGPEAILPLERGPGGRLGVRNNSADGGARTPEHFILAIGDDQVANAMASVAGEKVTLLHVRNNWGSLNGSG